MIECVFTLDYEIYGNGTGSLRELVYEPTKQLMSIFRERHSQFVIFPELLELRKIEEYMADEAIADVRTQLCKLFNEGYEIGLHLHSWWFNAHRKNNNWFLDWNERNLCTLPRKRIAEIIDYALEYLRVLITSHSFRPICFRNGLWAMQPTSVLAEVLIQSGVQMDSTVFRGGRIKDVCVDYRSSLKNGYYWRFGEDVNTPDPEGILIELPIHTDMVPLWKMAKRKLLHVQKKVPFKGDKAQLRERFSDFARFKYPRKLDFCRMKFSDLRSTIDNLIRQDKINPQTYKPIVAIGHSKDLIDFETVMQFHDYLVTCGIAITNFRGVLQKLQPRAGQC